MNETDAMLDKPAVRRAFSRAAAGYEQAAFLQREICDRTLAHLEPLTTAPAQVLDLGAGTGYALAALRKRFADAALIAVDVSLPMLAQARDRGPRWFRRTRLVCADADRLPLRDASIGLVFSNLMLQWAVDLDRTLAECRRVLADGGLFLFSSFGPDTLKELRACWQAINMPARVHVFIDMHDVGDALIRAGFSAPVLDTETITVHYREPQAVLRDLKAIGATHATSARPRGLLGRRRLASLYDAYEKFRRADGTLPATWEVVYGHCWAPLPGARRQDGSTVATFPLHQLRRRG